MFHYRLIFPLLLLFALASCMLPDEQRLQQQNKELNGKNELLTQTLVARDRVIEVLVTDSAEEAAAKREELALKERQAALYAGCEFILNICPDSMTDEGRAAVEKNYSGHTSILFWFAFIGKCGALSAFLMGGCIAMELCWLTFYERGQANLDVIRAERKEAEIFRNSKTALEAELATLEQKRTALESNVAELENQIGDRQRSLADWQRACDEEEAHLRSLKAMQDLMKP